MILKIEPVFSEKIWGGKRLSSFFNIKNNKAIGEAWIVSGYKNNSSKILNKNVNLYDFYINNKPLFNNYKSDYFPLLIKLIDAKEDLSIQVHPNDEQAKELENYPYGKSEAWYILDTNKYNEIIIGTKIKDKLEIKNKIKENKWNDILSTYKIKKGDVFNILPGTLHAIKGNTFLYEVQQSSDITYRFYDYDRLDDNKQKRPLDVKKALNVLNLNIDVKSEIKNIFSSNNLKISSLIRNSIFNLEKWVISGEDILKNYQDHNFLIVTNIKGEGSINNINIKKYESLILTYDELLEINLNGNFTLLVSNPN
ncbi:MAG: class I mannose-6-phosphate isomerase [Candidatus Hepatoplasma vulgare]|nr:MAG: class I mannose-6-phosphate isomerase [Candidatus Hepatoplasma sp.]